MKTYNIRGAAMTLAVQKATSAVKNEIRSSGAKLRDFSAYELRCAAERHLSEHPEIVERARATIEAWRKNRSANTAQKNGTLNRCQ